MLSDKKVLMFDK